MCVLLAAASETLRQATLTNAVFVPGSLTSFTTPATLHTFTYDIVWSPATGNPTTNIVVNLPAGVAVDRVGNPSVVSNTSVTLGVCVPQQPPSTPLPLPHAVFVMGLKVVPDWLCSVNVCSLWLSL